MRKKNNLNIVLLIVGISILVLGTVLLFTVPPELKSGFFEMHDNAWGNKEWGFGSGHGSFPGSYEHSWNKTHGMGIWFVPLVVIVLFLFFGIGKRSGRYFPGHGSVSNPLDILRRSYAEGRMSREEYLEKKSVLEDEKEEK